MNDISIRAKYVGDESTLRGRTGWAHRGTPTPACNSQPARISGASPRSSAMPRCRSPLSVAVTCCRIAIRCQAARLSAFVSTGAALAANPKVWREVQPLRVRLNPRHTTDILPIMRVMLFLLLMATTFGALACERATDPFEAYLKVAEVEMEREQYEKAEDALLNAIDLPRLEDPQRTHALVTLLRRLGNGYRLTRKDPQRALLNFQRAFSIASMTPQPHWGLASMLLEIGQAYADLGNYPKAEASMREALSRQEPAPKDVEGVRVILGNLAEVCDKEARYDEAEQLYMREIGIMEANVKQNGLYKVWIAYPLASLAEMYRKQGRSDDADRYFSRSLAVMAEEKLDNAAVLATMENYARLLKQTGKVQEGERLEREAEDRRARQDTTVR